MIGLPAGTRIWIAAGVTDLRRGFTGLSGMVTDDTSRESISGHVFVFRGRRGDLIKMLWWPAMGYVFSQNGSTEEDSSGRKRQAEQCRLRQHSYRCCLRASDWRRPVRSYEPQMAV